MASYCNPSVFRVLVVDRKPATIAAYLSAPGARSGLSEEGEIDASPIRPIMFAMETALDGIAAVQRLESALMTGRPFSVAFVSHSPGGDLSGAETVARLWEYQPDLQVVFCVPAGTDSAELSARFESPQHLLVLEEPAGAAEVQQAARLLALKWDQFSEYCHRLQELNRVLDQRALKLQNANARLEREVAERRAAEARFAAAFRTSSSAMAVLAIDDGRVTDANDRFFELLGVHSQALLGRTLCDFPALDDAVSWASARALLPQAAKVASIECRFPRRSDDLRDVLLSAEVAEFHADSCILLTVTDVTQIRRLEDEVRLAQRAEAVAKLALGVTHRFNNLLTVIHGQASLLTQGGLDGPGAGHSVSQILSATEEATALSRKLASLTQRAPANRQPLGINSQVRQIEPLLRQLVDARIELEMDLAPNLPAVLADSAGVEQLLLNLATNARDAMPLGGRLTISTYEVGLDAQTAPHRHRQARPGRFVCLEMSDTGTGMDSRTLERIFDPFFSTKPRGQGSGLGLTVVESIAHEHGGWIEVQSARGEGSRFRILLPAQAGIVAIPSAPEPHVRPACNKGTVMLVEDEEAVRSFTRTVLEQLGYRVHEASNGSEALRLWSSVGPKVDLLLTDIIMPGDWTGQRLAGELRRQRPGLGVILMSGYGPGLLEETGGTASTGTFLAKPYSIRALKESVEQQLACIGTDTVAN
jgi:PAS domain S-box-containing protein